MNCTNSHLWVLENPNARCRIHFQHHLLELLEDVLCEVSGLKVTELAGEDHKPGHQGCKISQPLDCFGVI